MARASGQQTGLFENGFKLIQRPIGVSDSVSVMARTSGYLTELVDNGFNPLGVRDRVSSMAALGPHSVSGLPQGITFLLLCYSCISIICYIKLHTNRSCVNEGVYRTESHGYN
jgi:hypothetical protein